MPQIYSNFLSGTVTDNPLLIGSTTVNSAGFASLPSVSGFFEYMFLTLDPEGVNGLPEVVKVTAHTASATSLTVTRAQQATVARAHPLSTVWAHAVTRDDLNDLPHMFFTGKGDSVWGTAQNTSGRLAATGTDFLPLVSDAAQATGTKWAQLTTAGHADGSVTTPKLADGSVTAAKLAAGVQGIPSFANAAARDAFFTSPTAGLLCYLGTPGRYSVYTGSAWRDAGLASSQSTVRQYRIGFTGSTPVTIANTAGTYTVTFNGNEVIDTDGMGTSPLTSLTLSEGVWAINVNVNLAITTGAASSWGIPIGSVTPYLTIVVGGNGTATFPVPSAFGVNITANSGATFPSSASMVIPVAAGTVVSAMVNLPTPSISGAAVTTQLHGTYFQAVQIG
jgi:hypothetical protein